MGGQGARPHHWSVFSEVGGVNAWLVISSSVYDQKSSFLMLYPPWKASPSTILLSNNRLHPQCLASIHPSFHTTMIYNWCSCAWELISREPGLAPILSVEAITIKSWIISLDHCFPLLCWLGAIHLPFWFKVPGAGKLPPLPSLLPPPPQPQSQLMVLICPPSRQNTYWKPNCAGAKANVTLNVQIFQD